MERDRAVRGNAGAAMKATIADLSNNALIIRLHFTPNHLSRWLSPVHDDTVLRRAVRRGEPSVQELLLSLRNEELRVFPQLFAVSSRSVPSLDDLPAPVRSAAQSRRDQGASMLELMAEFRRLRQSTCSLLRSLPDSAWQRIGASRRDGDWSIRALAEHLVRQDQQTLAAIDRALDQAGVRGEIAAASRVHLDELVRLAPGP